MNKKNPGIILILILILMVILSGCSVIEERISREMWERSGVAGEMSYIQYQQMLSADALDEDGTYHSSELEQYELGQIRNGSVHVSFARNDYLFIEYFSDPDLTVKLETYQCRLDPGDPIYAAEPKVTNPVSSLYHFSEWRIVELDENGNVAKHLASVQDPSGEIYRIPEDFSGSELAIIPLGEYRDRTIMMNAVYRHQDGTKELLGNGYWSVDGKQYGNGSIKQNPLESGYVTYDYSSYQDGWYFDGSTPDHYWENSTDKKITFLTSIKDPEYIEYEIRLHPYGNMTIRNGVSYQNVLDSFIDSAATIFGNKSVIETQNIIDLVQVNGISAVNNFSDTELNIPKLRAGDEVLIRVPSDLKIISNDIVLPFPVESDAGRDYRFTVPDQDHMDFQLTVSKRNSRGDELFHERTVENAVLSVRDASGVEYREGSELPADDERITMTIRPLEDFCIYGRNVKNNIYEAVMKYADFEAGFDSIVFQHPVKPGIMVTFDTEDDYGTCAFWTGIERLSGTVMLREGQNLQFDYILDPDAGFEVVLTAEERKQLVEVWSPYASSRVLEVTDELQGKTLRCRDYVSLKEVVKPDVYDYSDTY